MKVQEYSAKNAELAIEEGLADLGVTREQAQIEIINDGSLFKKASVRITVQDAAGDLSTDAAGGETPGTVARDFLEQTLAHMATPATVVLTSEADEIVLEIKDESALFNRKNDVVDALQYLTSLICNAGQEAYHRVVLDSEHYRQIREEKLEKLADEMADKALERGFRIKLDPMNPYERRIIHTYLSRRADEVTTHSEGEEPNRFLVISPIVAKAKSYEPKDEATSDYSSRTPRDGKYHPTPVGGGNRNHGGYNNNNGAYKRDNRGDRPYNRDHRERAAGAPRSDGDRPYNRDNRENRGDRPYNRDNRGDRPYNRDHRERAAGAPRSDGDRPYNHDGDRRGGDRGGYRGGRDGAPKPPRATPTVFGTILTKPIKPADDSEEVKTESETEK